MRSVRACALILAALWACGAAAEPTLLLMEPEIDGDTGPGGRAAYEDRLELLEEAIARSIEEGALYEVADSELAEASFEKHRHRADVHACTPCAVESAREAGADRVLSVWVFRMSNLILSMQAILRDADTGEVRYSTAHDFRGDTDEAWLRAADRLVRGLEEDIPPGLR